MQELLDLDVLVGRSHPARKRTVNIGWDAAVTPESRIRPAQADDRYRREALERPHVALEDLDHLPIRVAPRGRAELGLPHGRFGMALQHLGDGIEDLLL